MSMSNATENATLKMHLQGTDPAYRAGATQYLALVTDAGAVDESAPIANECVYTGYARIPLTKATFWTDNGSNFTNAALAQFGKRTDAGATESVSAFVVVDTVSGAISQGIIGALSATLDINQNIQPQFGIGDLTITAE
jgi:hypothetical protein